MIRGIHLIVHHIATCINSSIHMTQVHLCLRIVLLQPSSSIHEC